MSFFYSPTSALNITRCVVLDVMADALAGKNPAVLKDPFCETTHQFVHPPGSHLQVRQTLNLRVDPLGPPRPPFPPLPAQDASPHHGYPTHVPTLTIF
ncbi:hypothetical protein PAPYR_12382 [Paratrimastix pyriformis]|uniref:Uncharacterized protein n=1 Tax=Paratrimastix pyriformis TaxID=342808 RepID=A0ABQ8U7C0_9EUKA|nr:hypothetical protein PAPYR_12382 [Paratrimastix pyriformis]